MNCGWLYFNVDFFPVKRIEDSEPDEDQEQGEYQGSDPVPRPGDEEGPVDERFQSRALAA